MRHCLRILFQSLWKWLLSAFISILQSSELGSAKIRMWHYCPRLPDSYIIICLSLSQWEKYIEIAGRATSLASIADEKGECNTIGHIRESEQVRSRGARPGTPECAWFSTLLDSPARSGAAGRLHDVSSSLGCGAPTPRALCEPFLASSKRKNANRESARMRPSFVFRWHAWPWGVEEEAGAVGRPQLSVPRCQFDYTRIIKQEILIWAPTLALEKHP